MKKLPKEFFERKTLKVARDLVGKTLVRKCGGKILRQTITEVEAYVGPHDLACHSAKGRTARTDVMFGEAGTIYVYFVYGMHWMLNVVTEQKNFPSAILIRGTTDFVGPGRVTKNLKIDKSLNGKPLSVRTGLWIEDALRIKGWKIVRTPRIGVSYAREWAKKPYRFVLRA